MINKHLSTFFYLILSSHINNMSNSSNICQMGARNVYSQNQRYGKQFNLQTIIDYVNEMYKYQEKIQLKETIKKKEEYKPLYYNSKSKNLENLPDNLAKIFEGIKENTFRACVVDKPLVNQPNLTFFVSLLFSLDLDYANQICDIRNTLAQELKSNLTYNMKHSKLFDQFKYGSDLKWKKKSIIDDIACNKISRHVLKYIMDYFNINLFILDINEDKLIVCYPETNLDPNKNTVIMSLCDEIYEPVYVESCDKKLWKKGSLDSQNIIVDKNYNILLNNINNSINLINVIDFNSKNKVFNIAHSSIDSLKLYLNLMQSDFANTSDNQTDKIKTTKYYLCLQESTNKPTKEDKIKMQTTLHNAADKKELITVSQADKHDSAVSKADKHDSAVSQVDKHNSAVSQADKHDSAVSQADKHDSAVSQADKHDSAVPNQSFDSGNQYDEILCSETCELNEQDNQNCELETEFCPEKGIVLIKQNNEKHQNSETSKDEIKLENTNIQNEVTNIIKISNLKKMKLNDLIKVAESINVVPTLKGGKYKTKNQLMIEINDYYKLHNICNPRN